MEENYKLIVNKDLDFNLNHKTVSDTDIIEISNNKFHILQNHKSFTASIEKTDFNAKLYTVKVNNNTYNISIKNDLDLLIDSMGFAVGKAKKINEIKSPMPGLILEVAVSIGQEVKEDDSLLVLEAMKMENNLTSPTDGIVKAIHIKKGDAVDKGTLLIEFE